MENTAPHTKTEEEKIWQLLQEVKDPEVPVLSILDLGMVRSIQIIPSENNKPGVQLTITPTYSGCPAIDAINMDIRLKLLEQGYKHIQVIQCLSPVWTTDWITEEGRRKLKEFGIAPPNPKQQVCHDDLFAAEAVPCPRCQSYQTEQMSRFGSTACKALYRCSQCGEPFDYFKCH